MSRARAVLIGPLLMLANVVNSHDYPFYPVVVELRIEPTQIRAHIDSHAGYLLDVILNVTMSHPLPGTGWPIEKQNVAKDYVLKSFYLEMDGRPLAMDSFECRFVQEPLRPIKSRVQFDVVYRFDRLGERISGESRFFREAWEAHERAKKTGRVEKEHGVHEEFRTELRVIGQKELVLNLPIEEPGFNFPTEGFLLTSAQKKWEATQNFLYRIVASPFFWIVLIFLGYKIRAKISKKERP